MPTDNTDSQETTPEEGGRDSDVTTAARTKLVVEFTVPTESFLLSETLRAYPGRIVEFEQLVPTHDRILPYLWVTKNGDDSGFESTLHDDPTVADFHRVAELDDGILYQVDWSRAESDLLGWIRARDVAILQSEGEDGEWALKLRVASRDVLREFQRYCRDHGVEFDLIRLYELTDPKIGQYNVTEKQREILITALEMGFFEIPREATLGEVADAMDISKRAASERLRRGNTNLVSNTLTIGQPTGVGLGTGSP